MVTGTRVGVMASKQQGTFRREMFRGNGSKTILGKIYDIRDIGDGREKRIMVSLMSVKMFKADLEFMSTDEVNREEYGEGYHPYIYEYICDTDDEGTIESAARIYNSDSDNKGWRRVYFTRNDVKEDIELELTDGTHLVSMSPLKKRGRGLCICKEGTGISDDVSKIIAEYENKSLEYISGCAKKRNNAVNSLQISAGYNDISGSVYSVGMGNNIKISLRDTNAQEEFTLWFDVGASLTGRELDQGLVKNSLKRFYNEKMDMIILSHWDLDHIIAVGDFDERVIYGSTIRWMAPDLMLLENKDKGKIQVSKSAVRLYIYLNERVGGRFIAINSLGNTVYVSGHFAIYQGTGKSGHGSKENNIGLVLRFKNHLFCGDCAYEAMPAVIRNDRYDFVVAAHHGSDKTIPDLKAKGINARVGYSVGLKMDYPSDAQKKAFDRNGFARQVNTRDNGNIIF